ncbi:MAG: hexose kinase [Chloroflexi bacterium]|nr:hexose kinase [Chloroflexota bacterium]MCC6897013.1 hexose kinase [Anaerolineae bacterium]
MIFCISPNPALDHTLVVPAFKAGTVLRAQSSLAAAGGKGLNVARAAQILGAHTLSFSFLGGHTGRLIADYAQQESLEGDWTWIDGETRTCVIVTDAQTGEATVINEQGPQVTDGDWVRLHETVLHQIAQATDICFSGSLPPNSPIERYVALVSAARDAGKRVWVDTSSAPLHAALPITGITIKINGDEAGGILGHTVSTPELAVAAAYEFQKRGTGNVVITLGKDGAVMVHPSGRWWAKPPAVVVQDPIGSGDSFLAGLVTAYSAGLTPDVALKHAVAAGAANATTVGGGDFPLETFKHILAETTIKSI